MKYYYKDSVAAYWMQEHHGIQLSYLGESITLSLEILHCYVNNNLYVHEESLLLLEPQIGDFLQTTMNKGHPAEFPKLWTISSQDDLDALDNGFHKKFTDLKVIQRNGKSFHWPEIETTTA